MMMKCTWTMRMMLGIMVVLLALARSFILGNHTATTSDGSVFIRNKQEEATSTVDEANFAAVLQQQTPKQRQDKSQIQKTKDDYSILTPDMRNVSSAAPPSGGDNNSRRREPIRDYADDDQREETEDGGEIGNFNSSSPFDKSRWRRDPNDTFVFTIRVPRSGRRRSAAAERRQEWFHDERWLIETQDRFTLFSHHSPPQHHEYHSKNKSIHASAAVSLSKTSNPEAKANNDVCRLHSLLMCIPEMRLTAHHHKPNFTTVTSKAAYKSTITILEAVIVTPSDGLQQLRRRRKNAILDTNSTSTNQQPTAARQRQQDEVMVLNDERKRHGGDGLKRTIRRNPPPAPAPASWRFIPLPSIDRLKPKRYNLTLFPRHGGGVQRSEGSDQRTGADSFVDALRCEPFAIVSSLHRPQHALHFLWSIVSIVALSVELNVTTDVPVHVMVQGYGTCGLWANYTRDRRLHFPHLELARILSDRPIRYFADRQDDPKRQMDPFSAMSQLTEQHNITINDQHQQQRNQHDDDEENPIPPHRHDDYYCYDVVAFGSIPMIIPPAWHHVRSRHWAEVRRRAIRAFDLKRPLTLLPMSSGVFRPMGDEVSYTNNNTSTTRPSLILQNQKHNKNVTGYVLVIRRRNSNRRIDNDLRLITKLRAAGHIVVPVYWEGLSLREMLEIAHNARAMVGVHGNGLAWACFMPPGSKMVELAPNFGADPSSGGGVASGSGRRSGAVSSATQQRFRNEVTEGINQVNSANVGGVCDVTSLSLRIRKFREPKDKTRFRHTQLWKELTLVLSDDEIRRIVGFVSQSGKAS